MSQDTYGGEINNPQSLNLYAYVESNPLRYNDPTGHFKWEPYDVHELRLLLEDARDKVEFSKKNKYYQVYKDFIWERYGFESFMDTNQYSYLFDLLTGTSAYTNNAGKASWAENQLVSAFFESKEAEYVALLALGMAGGVGGRSTTPKNGKSISTKNNNIKKSKSSKNSTGCNCFTAGTKVQTDEGEKNIEDIEVGDKVLSKDEATGEVAYKEVTATFNHETDEIYKIHVGGQEIESTFNHPFYVEGKGWTFVKDLKPGDLLVQSDGNTLKIESIELEHKQATVYNLRVDDFHTYFVSDLGIWVHNTNCWGKFSSDDLKKLAQADQKDIKRITGNADDAFGFFKEQVSSYKEVSTGVFVGKDANGVTFTYRAASKSGPPTIDVNGISGVRKIKFLED